jgi:hypothetical protein
MQCDRLSNGTDHGASSEVAISTPTAIASLEARIAEHQLQSSELSDRVFSEVFSEV